MCKVLQPSLTERNLHISTGRNLHNLTERNLHISSGKRQQICGLPEIWGGLECTFNRVGDRFRDQLEYTGHYRRPDDLKKIADLGIKKIRYPILWERHVGSRNDRVNWEWAEQQLLTILKLGMEPIVGLVHHGSGPSFTDLLDPLFPEELAAYARKVAERFPFIRYYTPVNEPLTTARFSGLYGLWYPHKQDQRSFVKMLINQCTAIVRSMQVIREINPLAELIQTEDLGKTYSTVPLKYQADFENERRWFSLDLLCGKVKKGTKIRMYFESMGATQDELDFFLANPSSPQLLGFNYYITSERFLDHDYTKYPLPLVGGNGNDIYADVEAVRVPMEEPHGLKHLLSEAWERYNMPMAVTEVHIGCTREEQMRWLKHVWETCCGLRKQGIDIRAVTPWSLFGAFDWNSLLTNEKMHYEPGVFDISSGEPRPTAMAGMIKGLALEQAYDHPLLKRNGWWMQDHRFMDAVPKHLMQNSVMINCKPLLIIGKNGSLASAFAQICKLRAIPAKFLTREEINIMDSNSIEQSIRMLKPWAVINCAGFVDVDLAETEPGECMKINAEAPALLASVCSEKAIPFMTFSSDLVFNGQKKRPYTETDHVAPLNVYGESKALGEQMVFAAYPDALVIRSSAFFGPWDKYNFVYSVLRSIEQQATLELPGDVVVSPTYLPDLVHASLDLLIDGAKGIWHLANEGFVSWADFAQEVARHADRGNSFLVRKKLKDMSWVAARPVYSVLKTEKGPMLPTLDDALERYFREAIAV